METPTLLSERLEALCRRTMEKCTVTVNASYDGIEAPTEVFLPCGDLKYPSFWVRDCAMSALSGLMDNDTVKRYLKIFLTCGQNGEETISLKNGLSVPPWAMCDHVNYNGKPVWFPGTLDDGEDQGSGAFGKQPPLDDAYWLILMAGQYVGQSGDMAFLAKELRGVTVLERLCHAWEGYSIDRETELCTSQDETMNIDWGFTDTVQKSGKLLFSSLLRNNAAGCLMELLESSGKAEAAKTLAARQKRLRHAIRETFYEAETGWLRSATGICAQRDVWGTLYAVWSGILTPAQEAKTVKAVTEAYLDGETIAYHGYVRHIRTSDDFVPGGSPWERVTGGMGKPDWYQNGAYWATPSGWLFWTLYLRDPALGERAMEEFALHTEANLDRGTPWEWMNHDGTDLSGLWYGTSAALPYLGALRIVKDMEERRDRIYEKEAERTSADTLAAMGEGTVPFVLLTDTHLSDNGEDTCRNIAAVDRQVNYRFVLHLGDFLNGFNPPKLSKRLMREETAAYAGSVSAGRLYCVQGNHDGYRDETYLGQNIPEAKPDDWYHDCTRFMDSYPGTVRHGDEPWFYADFPDDRLRLIGLCSMEYTFDREKKDYRQWMSFRKAQTRWLLEEALQVPEGWTVLLASHVPPISCYAVDRNQEGAAKCGGEDALEAVLSVVHSRRCIFDGKEYDFTGSTAHVAAWLYGHIHGDCVQTVDGVPMICIASETAYIPQLWPIPMGSYPSPRTAGTTNEDCWDSAVLDTRKHTLSLIRFGAGEDRIIQYP